MKMNKEQATKFIAKRIAAELKSGTLVNLGVGIPTLVSDFVGPERDIQMHGENGVIGVGNAAFEVINNTSKGISKAEEIDEDVINSGAGTTAVEPGASFFDSATSFAIIRGGHVDVTVLGTMEVAENGDIANYMIPGKRVAGMGGAMDLCVGAKKVIVATFHTQGSRSKLLRKCTLPLTASKAVNTVVTELGVFDVTEQGFTIREYNPAYTFEEIQAATNASLFIPETVKPVDSVYYENL